MSRRLSIFAAVGVAALALAVAALAFSAWSPPSSSSPTQPRLALTSMRPQFAQTRAGKALITIPNAEPGQIAQGATTLTVSGAAASVTVRATNLRDVAGRNRGRLIASDRLWIDVRCALQGPCGRSPFVYRGPLRQMGIRSLGIWSAGTHRTYRVRVWLLRGSKPLSNTTGDNAFQGSRATFGLAWQAIGA